MDYYYTCPKQLADNDASVDTMDADAAVDNDGGEFTSNWTTLADNREEGAWQDQDDADNDDDNDDDDNEDNSADGSDSRTSKYTTDHNVRDVKTLKVTNSKINHHTLAYLSTIHAPQVV